MAAQKRLVAYFEGHVQGVGFRFTTVDIAERFPEITGFVRNLRDGRVEIVAEGTEQALAEFISAVERAMRAHISNTEKEYMVATGEFSDFGISR
jgi:acylphosphatase